MLEVLYHHAKFGGARISPAAGVAKKVEFFLSVCLFVCLFVTLLNVRVCAPEGLWSTETILMPFNKGRLVVVHLCSAFSDCCQLATPLNAKVQNMAKYGNNWDFFATRGRQNKLIETKFGT